MTLQLRSEDLAWRQIDDEIVVLDSREGTYLALNGSGAVLWPALACGATFDGLVSMLVGTYGIDHERASADTDDFVASLANQGLLAEQ